MKGFLVLLCCIGSALSAPQYNYNPPTHGVIATGPSDADEELGGGLLDVRLGSIPGPSFAPSNAGSHQVQHLSSGGHSHSSGGFVSAQNFGHSAGHSSGGFGQSVGGFVPSTGGFASHGVHGGAIGGGAAGFGGFGTTGHGVSGHGSAGGHHQTIVTKQFFIHSAPEEQDAIGGDKVINLGPGRKHYRVVFIKAPHQNVQGGRVRFVAPANEEKTVIYVLSKKTDLSEIAADVQQAHSEPTKPDVFFIKYKTPEEAQHAQRQIQAQYDHLGGTSQISDEGVAPISSVIGALGQTGGGHHAGGAGGHHVVSQGGFASSGSTGFGASSIGATGAGISHAIGGSSGHVGGHAGASYLPPNH